MTIDVWARESSYRFDVHSLVSLLVTRFLISISAKRTACPMQLSNVSSISFARVDECAKSVSTLVHKSAVFSCST
jgi:hypothetical protein